MEAATGPDGWWVETQEQRLGSCPSGGCMIVSKILRSRTRTECEQDIKSPSDIYFKKREKSGRQLEVYAMSLASLSSQFLQLGLIRTTVHNLKSSLHANQCRKQGGPQRAQMLKQEGLCSLSGAT